MRGVTLAFGEFTVLSTDDMYEPDVNRFVRRPLQQTSHFIVSCIFEGEREKAAVLLNNSETEEYVQTLMMMMMNHFLQLISWKHKPLQRRRCLLCSDARRLVAQTPS